MLFPTLFKGCSAILDVTLSTLWSALNASCSTLDKAMLLGETLKGLLVVGACLSAWAAPLGVTSSPQARRCDRTEQGSKETSESLESHHDDKLCEISTTQLPASSPPYVKEWREPGRTADVLDNARDEGEVTFAEAGKVQIRDSGLFQKEGDQNLSVDNVTFRSLSVDKNNISLSAGPTESVTSGPGNVNMEVESVTAAGAADQINSQSDAVQKVGPSVVPFGQSTGRSAETQVVLGHGEDVRQGSLLYTDLEEDKGRVRMRDLPPEHKREWDVESITKEHFTQLSTTEPSPVVSSTAHDSASQSPWTVVHPVSTSPTTPGIPDGEARRSRVAEENLFTASDLQDKALAPGILQPDLTLSSREPELGGTWTEPLHLQGVEETSISPLSQEVGTEATMSSEDLPLIFEPLDDVTPPSGSAQASELSVAMAPATGMLREAELEQAVSVDTERVPPDASILGPSDWPSPWQMSGSENSDAVAPYQMPVSRPFSGADLAQHLLLATIGGTMVLWLAYSPPSIGVLSSSPYLGGIFMFSLCLRGFPPGTLVSDISASVGTLPLSPSPVPATIHQDIESTQLTALQTKSGLDELLILVRAMNEQHGPLWCLSFVQRLHSLH